MSSIYNIIIPEGLEVPLRHQALCPLPIFYARLSFHGTLENFTNPRLFVTFWDPLDNIFHRMVVVQILITFMYTPILLLGFLCLDPLCKRAMQYTADDQ